LRRRVQEEGLPADDSLRMKQNTKPTSMLADIYNSFAEGFDTADLKDAKALLEELNNSPR
jgi:hypothetical protein